MFVCLEHSANDLHVVQLMPLPPNYLLLRENPEWFNFLVLVYQGCPGKRPLNGCSNSSSWSLYLPIERWSFGWTRLVVI